MSTAGYGSSHDSRQGLGYGITSDRLHKPRKMGRIYPYIEIHEFEDYEDEETEDVIRSKMDFPVRTDTYSAAGTDPFYFVAGNTKLADCFERPDKVLEEVFALGSSMSPIPTKRSNRGLGRSGGSSFPSGAGNYKRTGTKKGYFSSPPKVKFQGEESDPKDEEDVGIDNLHDLAQKQDKRNGTFSAR